MTPEILMDLIRTTDNKPARRIECADGYSVSVQASEYHYCEPRTTNARYYTHVEVDYPSELAEELVSYADSFEPIGTVFGYVPTEIVVDLINKHGGVRK